MAVRSSRSVFSAPVVFFDAINMFSKSSGICTSVFQCYESDRSTLGVQHQCSSICDGTSTKSRGPAVPYILQ